ncbi:MAG: HAD family phosphatase [Bacteroidia bacterium]|nr:HAD family phosphatase [Bacteroidia bacterium]
MDVAPQPIDTIIFDLGGVLIDWNPRYLYKKVFVDPGAMEFFLTEICHGEWNHLQDAGRPWKDAIEDRIEHFPEYEAEIRMFYERWSEMLGGVNEDTLDLLNILATESNLRLLALTNWSAETWVLACERYDFLKLFEGIVVSGEEKIAKPDPAIFKLLCNRYQVDPAHALFIDDSEANVIGARSIGLNAIHYQDDSQLREELEEWL